MTYQARLITNYKFQPSDVLMFDTNVWFYIYGPTILHDPQTAIYSKALNDILSAKSRIYTDTLIVSEFMNRYARLEYQLLRRRNPDTPIEYKHFRQSSAFKPIAKVIATAIKKILSLSHRLESEFSTCDIDSLLDEYTKGKCDFNDLMLIQICQKKELKLVTHDRDFKGQNILLLTANKRLLQGK